MTLFVPLETNTFQAFGDVIQVGEGGTFANQGYILILIQT